MEHVIDTYINEASGIFKLLSSNNYPFLPADNPTQAIKLDILYYNQHSGDKLLAPYYFRLYNQQQEGHTQAETNAIVMAMISNSIALLYADKWNKLYNSLVTATYNALANYDIEEEETPDIEVSNTTRDNVYGFDDTSEDGVEKDLKTYVSNTTGTNTKTKTGRDGRVTAQKLLEQELNIRKNLFYEILFSDIDSILALKIYD